MSQYRSNGKLLITGEYVVLDGALALALPTVYGQSLNCVPGKSGQIHWNAVLSTGQEWFSLALNITNPNKITVYGEQFSEDELKKSQVLITILEEAQKLNPEFLNPDQGYKVVTTLEFPTNWGLGSSSTLINNIASWAKINPYTLLQNSFKGSGYDIACAQHKQPLIYNLDEGTPKVELIDFNPVFSDSIHFVHLNKKQNSREGIKRYKGLTTDSIQKANLVKSISELTLKFTRVDTLDYFEQLLLEHESIIATAIQIKPVKQHYFGDFNGEIKSLGAWGGDFIMVTGTKNYVERYFKNRGFNTILPYNKMVL